MIRNVRGITLVELLVVLILVSGVFYILVPFIWNIILNASYTTTKMQAVVVLESVDLYRLEERSGSVGEEIKKTNDISEEELREKGYLEKEKLSSKTKQPVKIHITEDGNYLCARDVQYTWVKSYIVDFPCVTKEQLLHDPQYEKAPHIKGRPNRIMRWIDEKVVQHFRMKPQYVERKE